MSIFLGCLLLQYLTISLANSPWWTPDFLILGIVLALAKSTKHWIIFSVFMASVTLLWAVRLFVLLAASSVTLGALIAWAVSRWNFSDRRVLTVVIVLAVTLMNGLMIWVEDLWSWRMLFLLGARVLLTLLCFFCIYPLWKRSTGVSLYG